MKKQSHNTEVFIGLLIAAIGFLPAAALARDGGDFGATLPVNISARQETEDGGDGASIRATTTADIQQGDEIDNSDDKNQGDEADGDIEIDHDSADNATTTIDAPEHVTNRGELRSFLNHIVKEDNNISDVRVSSSTVETHYEMPAKFLWAIPMDLTADVTVHSNGSVTVTYPWYAFLFATHDSDNKLSTQLGQSATSTGTATLSASAQAQLLNRLFANLKTSSK